MPCVCVECTKWKKKCTTILLFLFVSFFSCLFCSFSYLFSRNLLRNSCLSFTVTTYIKCSYVYMCIKMIHVQFINDSIRMRYYNLYIYFIQYTRQSWGIGISFCCSTPKNHFEFCLSNMMNLSIGPQIQKYRFISDTMTRINCFSFNLHITQRTFIIYITNQCLVICNDVLFTLWLTIVSRLDLY